MSSRAATRTEMETKNWDTTAGSHVGVSKEAVSTLPGTSVVDGEADLISNKELLEADFAFQSINTI